MQPGHSSDSLPVFLAGGGAMGARLRAFDWSSIGLGEPRSWPAALRSALAICLSSNFPTCVYWGRELHTLYNDAWAPIPAERHPWCLGRPARQVWADIWDVIEPQFRAVFETGKGFSAYDQFLPMQRLGRVRETYWTYSFTPLFDENEQVVGILNQGHETTAAVVGEREHKDEVARLRDLFELAPGAVTLLQGPRHVIEMANAAFLQLVGSRDVIGRSVAEALPEIAAQGFVTLLDEVYRSGETYNGEAVTIDLQRMPGAPLEERSLDFVYQPIRDASGCPNGILVQATDVTERDRALQQLREADRRKDVFLATLAHELRNPLAPIATGLQQLKVAGSADTQVAATREMMERQLRHLMHLVDDLLDVSRISTGKITLRRERVALRSVLARAVESTRALFEQKSQRLDVSPAEDELYVQGDVARLTQVFANLLGNACKFTQECGCVALGMHRDGELVRLTVTAGGMGAAPASIAQVFELFEQAQVPGAAAGVPGVGLALVSQLVQLHGGRVEVHSDGDDGGSRFTVWLPLAERAVAAQRTS